MARSKLKLLYNELAHYLGVPYARNVWKDKILTKEAVFGGKGDWQDLEYATQCASVHANIKLQTISSRQKYNLQKKYHIGIDCSGLAYHLADYWYRLNGFPGILFEVTSATPQLGRIGVRSLSAKDLCASHNSNPVVNLSDLKTGDFIRMDKGHHLLFVVENQGSKIIYANSSDRTHIRGVHLGQILISHPDQPLQNQLFSDTLLTGQPYTDLLFPSSGDGLYRLKCFS